MSTDTWLTSLITATPQEGFELAITLSRRGVKYTQPDAGVLHKRARNMPTPPTPSPPLPRWLQ